MNPLGQRIAALIGAQGPIGIAQYMTMALHDREEGYYATRDPLGVAGDFITAPEISQMFGELLGLWLAQMWHDQGRPQNPLLVELGPGRGTLMADALRALQVMPKFREALEVVLVEASPVLRKVQEESLRDFGVPVRWTESFNSSLTDRPLFLVANEFFDALPIRQYVKTERGWCERMVTVDQSGALSSALTPAALPAGVIPPNRVDAPIGGVYEMSSAGEAVCEDIGHAIARNGGGAIIIDYGYDTPGFGETLQAVARHQFADVLADPGTSDLSAHVDFHALASAATRGGARTLGPITQGKFLITLGILERAQRLGSSQTTAPALARLTKPDQMGTLFKALAIVPKNAPPPPGF